MKRSIHLILHTIYRVLTVVLALASMTTNGVIAGGIASEHVAVVATERGTRINVSVPAKCLTKEFRGIAYESAQRVLGRWSPSFFRTD